MKKQDKKFGEKKYVSEAGTYIKKEREHKGSGYQRISNSDKRNWNSSQPFARREKKEAKNFNVVYGKHAVLSTIENPKRIVYNLYLQEDLKNEKLNISSNIRPIYKSRAEMQKMCKDGDKHQGYIAEVSDLIDTLNLSDHIKRLAKKEKSTIFLLDQINDPHNLGAILRSGCCFGVDLVITTKFNMPSINASVIRSSAGMSELIEILTITNLNETIRDLKVAGFMVCGMDGNGEKMVRDVAKKSQKIAVIMGSEGSGMRQSVRENCDEIIKIPMNEIAESLNVSNAAAICMYEIFAK